MCKKDQKKPPSSPIKLTRTGVKAFNGAEDGVPFESRPKTPEEREAISRGMREANDRKKAYAELLGELIKRLKIDLKSGKVPPRDVITAIDTIIKALGDYVNKQEIIGNLGVEKVFISADEKAATDEHINHIINDES